MHISILIPEMLYELLFRPVVASCQTINELMIFAALKRREICLLPLSKCPMTASQVIGELRSHENLDPFNRI